MKISQRNATLCLENRNKTFPVEMALVETPQILEAETAAQIIDYNQRVAPIFAEKAMAKNLIPQVKEAYPFGSTPPETVQSLQGLYGREYYNNHPCFAPWTHPLIDRVGRVSICCMMPNKPILGDLRQQSFKEMWTGENFAALRQTQNLPMFESCQKCDMFLENNRRLAEIVY
jgi:radical SAM protein with 4Fe4S-binding SPASM domain